MSFFVSCTDHDPHSNDFDGYQDFSYEGPSDDVSNSEPSDDGSGSELSDHTSNSGINNPALMETYVEAYKYAEGGNW